jgi:hypothetical protein
MAVEIIATIAATALDLALRQISYTDYHLVSAVAPDTAKLFSFWIHLFPFQLQRFLSILRSPRMLA